MSDEEEKKIIGVPFKKGNPGRPKGTRNKLGKRFLKDVLAQWEKQGASCLERMAIKSPNAFVRVVASVLPKEINVDGDINHHHFEEPVSNTLEWLAAEIKSNTATKKSLLN